MLLIDLDVLKSKICPDKKKEITMQFWLVFSARFGVIYRPSHNPLNLYLKLCSLKSIFCVYKPLGLVFLS